MRRIRTLGLALLAIFALGALASARAFAENPEILPVPSGTEPANFTSEAGATALQMTNPENKLECEKATNEGSFTSQDAGTLHITFRGCGGEIKGKKALCKSAGQGEGEVLVLAEMQLVDVEPTGTLDLGVWLKPYKDSNPNEMVVLECGAIKIMILGSMIGVVDNAKGELLKSLEKFTEAKVLWKENATTKMQDITECKLLKALCEGNKFQLEIEFGKGHELATEIADATFKFEKEYEVHF